jgi:hypothetical protein
MFSRGDLLRGDDLASIETRNGSLTFNARELLALLVEEPGDTLKP